LLTHNVSRVVNGSEQRGRIKCGLVLREHQEQPAAAEVGGLSEEPRRAEGRLAELSNVVSQLAALLIERGIPRSEDLQAIERTASERAPVRNVQQVADVDDYPL
jgi:hypothetical protein